MSCGLGAIILVFMLVKHNIENSMLETELLESDLARLESRADQFRADIAEANALQAQISADVDRTSSDLAAAQTDLEASRKVASSIESAKKSLEETIKNFKAPEKAADIVERPRVGEEQYLIGLKVEGPRIAILIDSSASMTDEKLIDVIRRKGSTAQNKQRGPKWQRTVAIAEWLVGRVPESSSMSLLTYNDKAQLHTGFSPVSGRNRGAMTSALQSLRNVVPGGATNLEAALTQVSKLNPSDIYLVTDGLPTMGTSGYKSLNPFADCSALWGGSAKISGACREKLFRHTIQAAALSGSRINVVLLPIEGDPSAAAEYWLWTSTHDGLLIGPANSWP